ncbi:MAG: hypothetical protein DRH90_16600 [Deltaproteobacteria bacterium]|nr:MAG: hypothetical protein DRH90_16600 [Deltaproteobacteria bacterium]
MGFSLFVFLMCMNNNVVKQKLSFFIFFNVIYTNGSHQGGFSSLITLAQLQLQVSQESREPREPRTGN